MDDDSMETAQHLLKIQFKGVSKPVKISVGYEDIKHFKHVLSEHWEAEFDQDKDETENGVRYFEVDSECFVHVISLAHIQIAQCLFDRTNTRKAEKATVSEIHILLDGQEEYINFETEEVETIDQIMETLLNIDVHKENSLLHILDTNGEDIYLRTSDVLHIQAAKDLKWWADPKFAGEEGYLIHF